ncbi:Sorcin [Clonorchis sinensis]|uniref:Sorcin n=1 Tax=Clonorchis sinensis TaxID=79923 RepID=A0A8T1MGE2_CLOSI|nr:Sorcin [Clonorchis sinensis]
MDVQTLRTMFRRADTDNSGQINAQELQRALSNGLNIPFNINTINMMMKMFDRDYSGQIEFNEFVHLVNYVEQWKNCFYRFDRDRSGSIDANEFQMALRTFRYNLSDNFVQYLIRRFDRTHRNVVAFDDFIYACVCLQQLTNAFRPYDPQGTGRAVMSFEQFLGAAFTIV